MKIPLIFLLGVIILISAIILNVFATRIGLVGWYDFLKAPGKTNTISYIWLFLVYPLALGVIAYYASKLLNL